MTKTLKIFLFSFLIGVALTITSIWWWNDWWNYFLPEKSYLSVPGEVFLPIMPTGCFQHGGPLSFFGTCIKNGLLNFGLDIILWSVIVFGFWMLIKFLKKK